MKMGFRCIASPVWAAWTKGLDRETYLKAVDEYLDFCEKEIPLRAGRIIDRLKDILDNN